MPVASPMAPVASATAARVTTGDQRGLASTLSPTDTNANPHSSALRARVTRSSRPKRAPLNTAARLLT